MGVVRYIAAAQHRSPTAAFALLVLAFLLLLAAGRADAAVRVTGTAVGVQLGDATAARATLDPAASGPATSRHGPLSGPAGSVDGARVELAPVRDGVVAVVAAQNVTLLGGRVSVSSISLTALASTGGGSGVSAFVASGVTVDGTAVPAGPGASVEIAGAGRLVFAEQVDGGAGAVRGNALRLEITDAASGLPPGTTVVIGHVDIQAAKVPEPPPASQPAPDPALPPELGSSGTDGAPGTGTTAPDSPPQVDPLPAPQPVNPVARDGYVPIAPPSGTVGLPRRPVPSLTSLPADGGYAFPVLQDYGYIDDYGAPRAVTGWHHGVDIFAPTGTPLVAVADGVLSKVGVNTLGGNRLWLSDDRGNEFYYAHLSAYAPGITNGSRVSAGQVIGFVGNSGQAITTPPHLHFEIHPGGLDSVNPYPYLLAWERGAGVARAFQAATVAQGQVPASGALLVEITPDEEQLPTDDSGIARAVG
jgi:murein DD-endopeptidase MepM/ murein hydrolase activator NlpD